MNKQDRTLSPLQEKIHDVIFGYTTYWGRTFDIALLWVILLSVLAVMLESVNYIQAQAGEILRWAEWAFTIFFTIEYALRLYSAKQPIRYIFSFFGIIDFLSIIPTYLSLVFVGTQYLIAIRTIRLMRVFRILKLVRFLGEADVLVEALLASRRKITVFVIAIMCVVVVMGTLMYVIESPEAGFTSIPRSIYWAIVTLTTVGYGDITPVTVLGQTVASCIMLLGYAIIAVPTGIVSAEMASIGHREDEIHCHKCGDKNHHKNANYCNQCGNKLNFTSDSSS